MGCFIKVLDGAAASEIKIPKVLPETSQIF